MTDVRPFRGVRYDATRLGTDLTPVVCPPYDVISPAQQQALYDRHPENFIRLELTQEQPGDQDRYARAGVQYRDWLNRGVLVAERRPVLYGYYQTFSVEGRTMERRGVMAALRLQPWEQRQVLRHEHTLAGPKMDRLRLMRACEANFSPIWGLYRDPGHRSEALWADCDLSGCAARAVDADGVEHRLFVIDDDDAIRAFQEALAGGPVYIADGHHRYETAMGYRAEATAAGRVPTDTSAANYVMAFLVEADDPSLTVFGTHRVLTPPRPVDRAEILSTLARWFRVQEVDDGPEALMRVVEEAREAPAFGVYAPALGLALCAQCLEPDGVPAQLAGDHSTAWRRLDLAALHTLVLDQLFAAGSSVLSESGELWFTRSLDEAVQAAAGGVDIAFLVRHTPVSETMAVADAGDLMPQKSTYFYPKPVSGLVSAALTGDVGPAWRPL